MDDWFEETRAFHNRMRETDPAPDIDEIRRSYVICSSLGGLNKCKECGYYEKGCYSALKFDVLDIIEAQRA